MKNTGVKSKAKFRGTTRKCIFCGCIIELWHGKTGNIFPFHYSDPKKRIVCKGSLKK